MLIIITYIIVVLLLFKYNKAYDIFSCMYFRSLFFRFRDIYLFCLSLYKLRFFFFFQAEDGIRDIGVTGVQTCALPIFSPIIKTLSPIFYEIYNQAYKAQQLELTQICGPGYRKALEFLIKDYIMSKLDEGQRDSIKKKLLAQCINDNIENTQIQEVAKRATWLGNDETHYLKEWLDKDISDLVQTIDLTIY